MVGYILNTTVEVYDVLWTTPHSIHTMKLIGLIFDYKDGNTKPVNTNLAHSDFRETVQCLKLTLNSFRVS